MKVNYLRGHGLSSIKERRDLLKTLAHQVTQSGMLTRIGLLEWKSDELMEVRTGRLVNEQPLG